MSNTVDLAIDLISRPSVTPEDSGCQALMAERLRGIGFEIEEMPFGEVKNLWARKGSDRPLFCFAGHTDVVPTGPLEDWSSDPFNPEIRGDLLYGRGAADMKGPLAAMITAVEAFLNKIPDHKGSIAFLITSDEEGPAANGTVRVVQTLEDRGETIDWCLVGEPTSSNRLADVVKNGRRGSLNGGLTVHGVQGHIAHPHLSENPIHSFATALAELTVMKMDEGNQYFPPTSFQISNIQSGTGANNIIPGKLEMLFNFRFSTETSPVKLQRLVEEILDSHRLNYEIDWDLHGKPFITSGGELIAATQEAILEITGYATALSTAGGTSDGRFIAPTGAQVLELGPLNTTIHKIDECVSVSDLDQLSEIYQRLLEKLL